MPKKQVIEDSSSDSETSYDDTTSESSEVIVKPVKVVKSTKPVKKVTVAKPTDTRKPEPKETKKVSKTLNSSRSRDWCFTINNYSKKDIAIFKDLEASKSAPLYYILGYEVGEKGTPHIQGYIYFKNARTGASMKKLHKSAHWEVARGTFEQNYDYCSKDEDFYEFGEKIQKQGKRSDLEKIAEDIKGKKKLKDIAEQYPASYIRYSKGIREFKTLQLEHRTVKPKVTWIYGRTGVGKTNYAYNLSDCVYIKDGTQWWDGYEQQDVVVIDDFDGNWPFRNLLQLLDMYPYRGQYKGGYVNINSPNIVITCDKSPYEKYRGKQGNNELSQLLRRIDEVILMERKEDGSCINTVTTKLGIAQCDLKAIEEKYRRTAVKSYYDCEEEHFDIYD